MSGNPPIFIRKAARALTLLVELLGFELVRVKPPGSHQASRRLIKPASSGVKQTPVLPRGGPDGTNGYFTVDVGCQAGINHLKSALSLLVKESLSLNRTPVVFTPRFLSMHNLGKDIDASWDKYIDLSKVAVTKNGTRDYVEALKPDAVGNLDAFAVLQVPGKHLITASENAEYKLIAKTNPSGLGHDAVYGHNDFDFDVEFCPSADILRYANRVINELGEYDSMHVRRGDMVTDKARCPNLENDTRPERILETVSRVLAKGARIYILTNEESRRYFDVLRNDYEIFQYFDFPELRKVVECDEPDNFFLYEIEQLIFASARTKIYTFAQAGGGSRISLTKDIGWT
jgi:hypothetical protein